MRCAHCSSDLPDTTTTPFCPMCGMPLAASGAFPASPPHAPASPFAAPGAVPASPPPPSGPGMTPWGPAPDGTGGVLVAEPPGGGTPGSSRSRIGISIGVIGVVVLLVVGLVAVRGTRGQTTGASSPDALVDELEAALTKKDPAAVIALLDPAEVPTMGELYRTTVDKVRSGQDVDIPKAFDALDVHITGVAHETTYLGAAKRFAKVSFSSGQLDWETHPDKLPDGIKARIQESGDALPEPESGSGSLRDLRVTSESGKRIDPFLVLAESQGRWYISLTMTAGQYLVETMDLAPGNFDDTPEPGAPAESPEAAITELVSAGLVTVDAGGEGVVDLSGYFPAAQTRALRIYGDSISGGLTDRAGEFGFSTGGFDDSGDEACEECGIVVDDLVVTTESRGELTVAIIESVTITSTYESCWSFGYDYGTEIGGWSDGGSTDEGFAVGSSDDGSAEDEFAVEWSGGGEWSSDGDCGVETSVFSWKDGCATVTEPSVFGGTTGEAGSEVSEETYCLDDDPGPDELGPADFGITDIFVVVSEERGGWVIDPVATAFEYGRTALSHLDDPKVKRILRDLD